MSVIFEACVDSVESALAAQQGGAMRLEVCANLAEGGITPSLGMLTAVTSHVAIPVHVLVRPRPGDFCYSKYELQVMLEDINAAARVGARGVVFGVLTPDGNIDSGKMKPLMLAAQTAKLDVTCHRAFDFTQNPHEALQALAELQVARVLTSGHRQTAELGIPLLQALVNSAAGQHVTIMAGGGVSESNAAQIISETGVRELHGSARTAAGAGLPVMHAYNNPYCSLSATQGPDAMRMVTCARKVKAIISAAAVGAKKL